MLFVSHDRELLARSASRIVAVEPAPGGSDVWVHGGGFASFHEARAQRFERYEELRRRWDEKHAQLKRLVVDMRQYAERSDAMASRYAAAQTRLRMFEEAGPPPEPPRKQDIKMRLRGGRTGTRAITCQGLELTGLMRPFDLEVFFGERVAVLGSNGSGKSHFLRLLAGQPVNHAGTWKLGARVVPGYFAQTHAHPELEGKTLVGVLWDSYARNRGAAMSALRRYELDRQGDQLFDRLSGGQQARFQILLLELRGLDRAAARRADRQPGPGIGRGPAGGPRGLRGHGAGGDPRPVVRPDLRPLPGLRRRRRGPRDGRAGLG